MPLLNVIPPYIDFRRIDVLAFYDKPIVFTCPDGQGHTLIFMLGEDSPRRETWIEAKISPERLARLKREEESIRAVFATPENGRVRVIVVADEHEWIVISDRFISAEELPLTLLPLD